MLSRMSHASTDHAACARLNHAQGPYQLRMVCAPKPSWHAVLPTQTKPQIGMATVGETYISGVVLLTRKGKALLLASKANSLDPLGTILWDQT